MKRWAVEQCYYENGRVRLKIRRASEQECDSMRELNRCDRYIDVFKSKKKAKAFAKRSVR